MKKVFFAILLLCSAHLCAQEYVIDLKHWDIKDGLPHRQVSWIHQDRQGLIWVATPEGLSSFDGYRFTNYTEGKYHVLRQLEHITEDGLGRMWLSCHRKGAWYNYVFDPITGEVVPLEKVIGDTIPHAFPVMAEAVADSSVLFIVTGKKEQALYSWKPHRPVTKCILPQQYFFIRVLPEKNCILVENDAQEFMLVDAAGHMLKKAKAPLAKEMLRVQNYWTHSLYVSDYAVQHVYKVSAELEVTDITKLLPKQEKDFVYSLFDIGGYGVLWQQGKLFMPGMAEFHDFWKERSSVCQGFRFVMNDDKMRSWVGNDFGLYMLTVRKNKFTQYFNDTTKNDFTNACRGISVWNNSLYVCNEFSSAYRIDEATKRSVLISKTGGYGLQKIYGHIIFGDVMLADAHDKVTALPCPWAGDGNCWCFYEYAPGKLYCGLSKGLYQLDESTRAFTPFNLYNNFPELAKFTVYHIGAGDHGMLWLCTTNGLYALDTAKGVTARYSSDDTGKYYMPASEFRHFSKDAQGIYWLATASGLLRWDRVKNTCKQYSQADGLSNNNLYAVYDDGFGNVWMSSDYGIMKMNKASGSVRAYTTEDGISNNEFNRCAHYRDDSGNIYFGSLYGVNKFNPRGLAADAEKGSSRLIITSFQQFNGERNVLEDKSASLRKGNTITMQPDDRFFTLEFALLNYSNVQQTSYYWKIDNIDTGWNIQKDRTLRLSRLPYDEHILRIKAQAADGSRDSNELTISLNVVRPFYLRQWFLIAAVLAAVATVIGIYRWRLYLLRRENERLDRTVKEKTRDLEKKTDDLELSLSQKEMLLKEVHHRVKNNLQVISSLLQMQSRGIDDEKARKALLEGRNRIMAIAAIHQRLYQKEASATLELSTFAEDIFRQIASIYSADGKQAVFENKIHELHVEIDQAVLLGLILNELFTNSFKYAFDNVPRPVIMLRSVNESGKCSITYHDNGPGLKEGIDITRLPSLGMSLITGLTEQLNGTVNYYYDDGFCIKILFTPEKAS